MHNFTAIFKWSLLTVMLVIFPNQNMAEAEDKTNKVWNGIWFTCEFSQRTRAPDDKCSMFDNEGFRVDDGVFSYLKMTNSTEKNCRGNKMGHCFNSSMSTIVVKESPIGKIDIRPDHLFVSYLGCKQLFSFEKTEDYYAVIPDEEKCFWASKRHFYVARYLGNISVNK